jgi:hypothetical protein
MLWDRRRLTGEGNALYLYMVFVAARGMALAGSDNNSVLDTGMLECLAVIAAANERPLVEELNLAVKTYVLKTFAEHGDDWLVERAFSDQSAAAAK